MEWVEASSQKTLLAPGVLGVQLSCPESKKKKKRPASRSHSNDSNDSNQIATK